MADCIRFLSMDAVQQANSGHPGAPLGMADIATVLFRDFMQFDAADPHWFDRDRFVLSNGHASMLLYSLLYLTGVKDMTLDELKRFRQIDSKTAGHPEYKHADGIETTTGPLGQGVANSVGFALAESIMNAKFGDDLCKHWTYVFMGDGCLMEGISEEAISMAGHYKLGQLIAFWDNNSITIDGATSLAVSDSEVERFRASGWHVQEIDGHDTDAIRDAITAARAVTDKPSMIACKTIIGFGFPTKAGTQKAHSDAPGEEEIAGARKILGWDSPPFGIPEPLLREWREIGAKGRKVRMAWADRVKAAPAELRSEFERRNDGKLPPDWKKAIAAARAEFIASGKEMATRSASGAVLDHLAAAIPELLGGSADLTPSNNTRAKSMIEIRPGEYNGTYMHYGVREHGMAAAMNGIALHGGLIPYGGTFLCFSDYCRPSIRLALAQTGNDACALASALRKDRFDVDLVQNATRNDMQRAIERLEAKVRRDSIVMIYFGGYGVQSGGQNYLIPVDAKIWDEQDVRHVGVCADWLFAGLKNSGAHVRLAVIDASRRNPYERRFRSYSRGLAGQMKTRLS
jgi:transketolase